VDWNQPDATQRENAYRAIRRATAAIEVVRPGALETAAFLVDEAKASYKHSATVSANLESKATALLGVIAAASGVLGVFGSRDGKSIVATPFVAVAMICVLIALTCSLYILRAKRFEYLDLGSFISAGTLREDNRLGLSLVLAETFRTIQIRWRSELRYDSRALFLAYAATGAATIALLVNAMTVRQVAPFQGAPANAGTPVQKAKP
jgi:hypothetical protein